MSVDQDALDILCEVFDDRIEDVMSSRDNLSYTLYDDEGYPVGAAIYDVYVKDEPLPLYTYHGLGCATVVSVLVGRYLDTCISSFQRTGFHFPVGKLTQKPLLFISILVMILLETCRDALTSIISSVNQKRSSQHEW